MTEGSYLFGEMVEVAFGREHKFGFTVSLDNPDDLDRIRTAARRAIRDELAAISASDPRILPDGSFLPYSTRPRQ